MLATTKAFIMTIREHEKGRCFLKMKWTRANMPGPRLAKLNAQIFIDDRDGI
jgi:hypothetical protein